MFTRAFRGAADDGRDRALGFFGLYLACEVAGVVFATVLWSATLGGRIGGPSRYLEANAALQRWWTATLFTGSVWLFSMKVHVEGLELARSGPILLFVRHASAADTVLAAALVANPNRILLRYVIKRELLWDPCLDIIGRRLPNAFVDRTGSRSRAEIEAVARLTNDLDARSAVLIYPEGTRFTAQKLAHGIEALRERKHDRLAAVASGFRNVLPPRLGGLVGQPLRVRLRRFPANTIPPRGRDEWLFERWAEMDDWIVPSSGAEAQSA